MTRLGRALREPGWPAVLTDAEITLRPLHSTDGVTWARIRQRSQAWLTPWDATTPPGARTRPSTFGAVIRQLQNAARDGVTYPFAIDVDGVFVGQISVNNIVRGSAQFGSIGYWIDETYAGRGIVPRGVAAVIDHCLTTARLHRIEICIRPENANSLRVVEKLGLREIGYAPKFLHIDGEWRDHRIFAITAEEMPPGGMLKALRARESPAS